MTHAELVDRAARWLRGYRRCKLVLTESKPFASDEHPDAIGWRPNGWSIVIECKTSRADLFRDKAKAFHGRAMGCERWYLIGADVAREGFDLNGAGVLRIAGRGLSFEVLADRYNPSQPAPWGPCTTGPQAELAHLVAFVRRVVDGSERDVERARLEVDP